MRRNQFGFSSLPPRSMILLGASCVASPLLVLAVLGLDYALASPVCAGALSPLVIHAVKFVALAALGGIALFGRRYFVRGAALDSDAPGSVSAFAAFILLTITGLCALIVIAQWIAVFALPCMY